MLWAELAKLTKKILLAIFRYKMLGENSQITVELKVKHMPLPFPVLELPGDWG